MPNRRGTVAVAGFATAAGSPEGGATAGGVCPVGSGPTVAHWVDSGRRPAGTGPVGARWGDPGGCAARTGPVDEAGAGDPGAVLEGGPAVGAHNDGGKGTITGLEQSSKKSNAVGGRGGESVAKGKEVSSKTTWREMMVRLECRSKHT